MNDIKYLWLLANKLVSIGLRPLAVIFEAFFAGAYEVRLLPIVIPASMLIAAMISVPVHRDFYQFEKNSTLNLYLGALSALLLISGILTYFYFYFYLNLDKSVSGIVFLIICGSVISDKLVDEVNRYLEYQKKYTDCFFIQLIRNFWLLTYCIALGWKYQGHEILVLISIATQLIMSLVMLMLVFKANYKNLILLRTVHLNLILLNSPYVLNGILPSWLLNTARLTVSVGFSQYGSVFLLATQMASIFPIIIDIAYISRCRKMIARKTNCYSIIIKPIVSTIFISINTMLLASLLIYNFGWVGDIQLLVIFAIFLVVMSSLSAVFSEILFWSLSRANYYFLAGGLFLIIGLLSYIWGSDSDAEIIPMLVKSILLFNLYYLALYIVVCLRGGK